jgi:dTDP-glucose 4,6-dehydratase
MSILFGKEFEVKIARPFTFIGPHFPLEAPYAIGNFLKNILEGSPVKILGDGTPIRSYLYAADLTIWLWTILFKGQANAAYNVGSEDAIGIKDLAEKMVGGPWIQKSLPIELAKQPIPGVLALRYVPSTQKAQNELNVRQMISLEKSIFSTLEWYRMKAPFTENIKLAANSQTKYLEPLLKGTYV